MNSIAIYTLTSELHNEEAVTAQTRKFLGSIHTEYDFRGSDYADYGSHALDLIFVRTGGTEGIFQRLLPRLLAQSQKPFYLLTSGQSNSLAASMEILSFLQQHGLHGEIIHGNETYIEKRISLLQKVSEARLQLQGCRLGIIGQPSDWLIASHADKEKVRQRLGIELVDIPMQELLDSIQAVAAEEPSAACSTAHGAQWTWEGKASASVSQALPVANRIYEALKALVERHRLQGFTLRCFDLLSAVHNTGCLALARLNGEGIVAGCEGDVPALLSMTIAHALTGMSGFQANPSAIDPATGTVVFAHCTIPLNMVERYELDTHFESGIGVGIRGYMACGPVTVFKVAGDLQRCFIEEGTLVSNLSKPDLCRTQQAIMLADASQSDYFLTRPIGNHHVIVPGHHKLLLQEMTSSL